MARHRATGTYRLVPILLALSCVSALSGCTAIGRAAHMYGGAAPPAHSFQYRDGASGVYYTFTVGAASRPDTLIFFYGATGCPSWKSVMPEYVDGLTVDARVFVLNKRAVPDRSTGLFGCGREFHLANNPHQWVADQTEFIAAQLAAASPRPNNVVLVGVSEGALSAVEIARQLPQVTHLAILGGGAYPMRRALATLAQKGATGFDVEAGWKAIASDPASIDKHWYGNPYRWWADVMDLDPLPDLLKLDMPILLGVGERDESVPVESARFLASRFEAAGKRNLTLRVYPGADHRLGANGVSHRGEFFGELSRILRDANRPAPCTNGNFASKHQPLRQ